jgi:hypothetical protein
LNIIVSSWSHGDTKWKNGDTALVSSDSDVARLAPCGTPRVFDDEVDGSISVSSVSNSSHGVVNIGRAAGLDNTAGIASE